MSLKQLNLEHKIGHLLKWVFCHEGEIFGIMHHWISVYHNDSDGTVIMNFSYPTLLGSFSLL